MRTLRSRVTLMVIALVVTTALAVAGLELAVGLAVDGGLDERQRAAIIIGAALGLGTLVLLAAWWTWNLFRPLEGVVRATSEIVDGRHPDEAFDGVELAPSGEVTVLADGVRELALRLREIDASDRRFLMSISHELRTPLTAIGGHAQLLEEDISDEDDPRTASLKVIQREATRLERLVEDIIDLAKLRSNRFTTVTESVWMDELGEHLLAIFADTGSDGGPRVQGEFEHVLFHSDGQRILQVLRNLVNNGLRYASTRVLVRGERVRGHVRLTVHNDGETISDAQREKIFEPFVGTKREGGMGLGLAIGRELALALGGDLRALPGDDGATFELELPLEPSDFGR